MIAHCSPSHTDMNPSPIASPVGWAGVHEQLWFINGLQSSLFPARNDDDGEVVNGMTLRKRKAEANGEGVRTRKRTRSSANAHIEDADDAAADTSNLAAHHDTSPSSTQLDKTAQLDTTDHTPDIDAHPEISAVAPEHTRRSTRQSQGTSTPSAIDTPTSLPANEESITPPPQRSVNIKPRARSSSSAVSCASGSTLAMSENGSGSGADTCVEPDDASEYSKNAKRSGKTKEKEHGEEIKGEKEEVQEVRVSARVRRLAPKKAEAEAQMREEELAHLGLNAGVEGKSTKKKRARGRRARKSYGS